MTFAFPVVCLVIIAIAFWICAAAIKASEQRSEKERVKTEGIVVEYVGRNSEVALSDSPYYPVISVSINGDVIKSTVTTCTKMWPESHPIGTRLNVLYRKRKLPLIGYVDEIRINEEEGKPLSSNIIVGILRTIALAILMIAIIIAVIG